MPPGFPWPFLSPISYFKQEAESKQATLNTFKARHLGIFLQTPPMINKHKSGCKGIFMSPSRSTSSPCTYPGQYQLCIIKLKKRMSMKVRKNAKFSDNDDSEYRMNNQNVSYRKWERNENIVYAHFLRDNLLTLQASPGRMPSRFFKRMSAALDGERNNHQCRTHHQKMLLKFSTIEKVISELGYFSDKKGDEIMEKHEFEDLFETEKASSSNGEMVDSCKVASEQKYCEMINFEEMQWSEHPINLFDQLLLENYTL